MRCDLEDIPQATTFESDVCIVGAGIAGLILARKLGDLGKTVHLLEAGGPGNEPRSQDLYASEMRGVHHRGTTEGRHRTFGGSSTRWAAQLLPYPDEVFEARAAVDHVGWPISGKDIARYYPEIHKIMGANSLPFDDSFPEQAGGEPCRSTDEVRVRFSKWAPFEHRNLAKTEGKKCIASHQVTVFFHANALAITFNAAGTEATGVTVKNYGGVDFTFKAKQIVITTGTIESSRLLLSSSGVNPAGAGNEHDQVGRYFFDHVACEVGRISGEAFPLYIKNFAPYYLKRTMHTPRFETSAALQEKLGILAVMGHFEFEESEDSGLNVFRRFLHDIQQGRLAQKGGQPLSSLPKAVLGGMQTVYNLKVRGRRIPTPQARISLRFDLEQKPCAESRILLSAERDVLGARKLAVDWRRSAEESESMHQFSKCMDTFLNTFEVELQWHEGLLADPQAWGRLGLDCFHPMGGTRMGTSPKTSVVDSQQRVHGIANLYVDSCAVYPTGGSSNPTFTLMALTLRLAELLAKN